MNALHEAFAAVVDQRGAFAAQRLGRERCRIDADGDGGRVELDEFRIGDARARACRDREAGAARLRRVGGDGVERADAAGRQHDGARGRQMPTAPVAMLRTRSPTTWPS